MFGSIGFPELALIFLVVILLFGPEKLPEFAKFFAKTVRTVKDALDDAKSTIKKELDEHDPSKEIKEDFKELSREFDPYFTEDTDDKAPK